MTSQTERVKEGALRLGFDAVGICEAHSAAGHNFYKRWINRGYHATMDYLARHADLKSNPENLLDGCRSVVAVALNYNQPNPSAPGQPRIAKYALGRDYHKVLRSKLGKLAALLESLDSQIRWRACVDSAPILEREYAHMAGLGWFGKNTCLIDSKRGSWFFIGLLLTTAELQPDEPAFGGCGRCRLCIDACPTGAIVFEDERWQVESRRCISYQTIEHEGPVTESLHGWTFGCDICQEVCPFNQPRENQPLRAAVTTETDFLKRKTWPSLVELAQIGGPEWDALTVGSPVRRTGIDGLRRNARLNLSERSDESPTPPAESGPVSS